MNTLPLTARDSRACIELDVPLHACTDSDSHVAQLVGTLLDDIAGVDHEVSHADVLQALAITTAVRMMMADAAEKGDDGFSLKLLDVSVEPASKRALGVA
jgi:hypothetical protein